ncbi:hypothetical protein F5Y00DRAFT_223469 [Daldinia vernicosa]|uniref:uncharacterized protein n=1 Tax=Daldinia vernicosa TaxID=114800 RepID=UPI0020086032|nr:uncharacterized protein F5Y00DRAFT_223469 [Daldinia vernicosa]KAI0853740.1 hypothetical protein F5Y00DRAFT_223469 [Daldinia vernicosa]
MTRERKKAPLPVRGVRALNRRAKMERAQKQQPDDTWRALNPLKEPPRMKHKTTFELVENTDKKKKLEFKITIDRHPPPGFEFVPVGYPQLTQMCKELSREQDAMIFIVSDSKNPDNLDHHVNRVGYHFRQIIVDQARSKLAATGQNVHVPPAHASGAPEPIPKSQAEIDAQADAVLRDLFPRIPHTDRREIIQHAFQKDGKFHGESKVGMVKELTLARRVQLAAIAHIRHNHTRYDELLKETNWHNARRAVEKPCLDVIVKWRGDEETGRDQLDEILREVIEISDTEEESEDESPNAESIPARRVVTMPADTLARSKAEPQGKEAANPEQPPHRSSHSRSHSRGRDLSVPGVLGPSKQRAIAKAEKRSARKTQRFRRYAAAAEALAGSSDHRVYAEDSNVAPFGPVLMDLTRSPGSTHPISSSREPTVVTRGTPRIEQMSRYSELRSDQQRFKGGPLREMMTVAHGLPEADEYASPQLIRTPESHRPKVGHATATHSRQSVPVSPVRNGLQDMLLQSIEPASPVVHRNPPEAPRILYREPQRFAEEPRVVSRPFHDHAGFVSRPESPRVVSHGNVLVTRRLHGADYPSGTHDAYPNPFAPASHQVQGEDLRRVPSGYFPDRPSSSFRGADHVLSQHQPWPVPSEGMVHYNGDISHRTRANPIIIDDNDHMPHRPRQVIEVQRHPGRDYPVTPSGQESFFHDATRQRDAYIRDEPRVVLTDAPPTRPRSASDYRRPGNYSGPGLTSYHEPSIYRVAAPELRRHVTDTAPDPETRYYRERSQHLYEPREWPGNVPREARAVPIGLARPEARYLGDDRHFQEYPGMAPNLYPQDRRENRYYRLDEVTAPTPQQMHYRHDYQPQLVAPPTHGLYIENHGSPHRHHIPEQRVVWVDR